MPAPPLAYNFDGGTDGVQLATTDTGSGDQFQNVTKAADATINYDSTQVHGGAHSLKIVTVTSATTRFGWTGLGAITTDVFFRLYIYATANPGADWKISNTKTSTAAASTQISVDTTGKLHVIDSANATLSIDSVNAIGLNQWVRVEYLINTGTGTYTWWLYNTPDAALGSHTETKTVTAASLGADTGEVRFGIASTSAPTNFTCWYDDMGVATAGQLGPSGAAPVTPAKHPPRMPLGV